MFSSKRLLDHGLAFFTILVWGITFLFTKELSRIFTSLDILFIRYLIAYIALWLMAPHQLRFRSLKEEGWFLLAAVSGASLYQYLENLSVVYTSPASVSFITAMAPLFTAIFAAVFLKEKITPPLIFGMVVALCGVFFISFGDAGVLDTGLVGDLIIFGSIWLWALYSIVVKKIATFGYPQLLVTRRIFFYALLTLFPFMIPRFGKLPYAALINWGNFGGLFFLGFLASALCFSTWNRSVDKLGATTTSKYLFVMPVITLVAQMIYDHSAVTPYAFLGMGLILVGLLLSSLRPKKAKATEAGKETETKTETEAKR